jgi:hypothetical protein
MSLHGERVDDAETGVAKSAPAVAPKFYLLDSSTEPKDADLVAALGGFASGVSQTETDEIGDTFSIATRGTVLVDSAAAVIANGKYVMSDASGDAVVYVTAGGHFALGIARSATSGGAGEQVMLELFETPISDPDADAP